MTDDHGIVTAEGRQASIGAKAQFAIPKEDDMAVVRIATGSCILLETKRTEGAFVLISQPRLSWLLHVREPLEHR